MRFINKLLNIFFPLKIKCIFCGRDIPDFDNEPFCKECKKESFFNNSVNRCKTCDMPITTKNDYCENCKKERRHFDKITSPFIYTGNVRRLIIRFKSNNAKYLAFPMAKLMTQRIAEEKFEFDLIIPVPLSEKSYKKRKYNQAELLANEIGKILNKPVRNDILFKVKETSHQKELGFEDRQRNLRGAYNVKNWKEFDKKNILLVDDVVTTCATANTCSKLLKKHAKSVFVASFARTKGNKMFK